MLKGNVLITGGAGYLGRATLRAASDDQWPAAFTCYSRDEEKQDRLRLRYPGTRCILGDILDPKMLEAAVAGHDVVIHAAAVKFVPEAEFNPIETAQVNVTGTINVARACAKAGVKVAVLVSTDKACLPVNLYGATKMTAERIWSEANAWGSTRFVTARYGNVVGSTGSIVPVFRRQLERNGRVTVTDPTMTRFWMPADEAVECIGVAARYAEQWPGVVVASRCASLEIGIVAEVIAGGARPIDVIGPRPGEKHDETLVHEYESTRMVVAYDHFIIYPTTADRRRAALRDDLAGWTYTSDKARRLERSEMAAFIADAELLG